MDNKEVIVNAGNTVINGKAKSFRRGRVCHE